MSTIVTRAGKGSPLTHTEVDNNFTNLNTDKAEVSSLATVATSGAYSDLSGTPTLATVATSGDYDDLIDKPTINTLVPSQSGNSGKVLTTDGSVVSWQAVNADPVGTAVALAIALG